MHINEMLNKKTYIGDIEPNPKEFGIWIKNDGSHMIYDYTNREWICNCSSGSKVSYYKIAAGTNIDDVSFCVAGAKIFDTSENRFEHVGSMMISIESMITQIAPNFSFATDEYYIAYLPIKISMPGQDGTSMQVVAPTLEDFIALMGLEMPAGITRITEEEYWDDSVPNLTFSVEMLSYGTAQGDVMVADAPSITRVFEFEYGMTWEQWVDSKYNVDKWYFLNSNSICWFKSDNPLYEVYIQGGFCAESLTTSRYVHFDDAINPDNYRLLAGEPEA